MRAPILLGLLVLAAAAPAWSQDSMTLAERAAAIERASTAPDGFRVVVGHVSRELGIPVDVLRGQRLQTGLDWGALLIANRLAKEARIPFDQVVAEARGGKAWEDIAREHKVDVAKLVGAVSNTQSVVERRAEDKAPPPQEWKSTAPPGSGGPTGMVPGILPIQPPQGVGAGTQR
jgi:hypothetical protein